MRLQKSTPSESPSPVSSPTPPRRTFLFLPIKTVLGKCLHLCPCVRADKFYKGSWDAHTDLLDTLSSEAQGQAAGGTCPISQYWALTPLHGQTSGTSKPHLLQPVLATHLTVQFPALASVPAFLYKVIHDFPVQEGDLMGSFPSWTPRDAMP